MKKVDIFVFPAVYREIAMDYVAYKQSLGFKYSIVEQKKVNRMLNYIYSNSKSEVILALTPELVIEYATKKGNESSSNLHGRQSHIRQFAIFLNLRGICAYIYPKQLVKNNNNFVPYIFTKEEIESILREADLMKPNKNKFINTPHIYPAVFRVLYGCGLRVSEALSLKCEDVDLDTGILTIKNGKNNVSRFVPMSKTLYEYLINYNSKVIRENNPYFFPARYNEMYAPITIRNKFYEFEKQAHISRLSNGRYPRLHDLRHTFSVHAFEQMITNGQDPYCSLPILSTYLGHKDVESTEKYLRLTRQYLVDVLRYSAENAMKIFPEV